jgi:spore maturation protein A
MAMTWIWTAMIAVSVVFGLLTGRIDDVGSAAVEGAGAAVALCIGICGITCLWTGA